MTKFNLKCFLGDLVGDCQTYKSASIDTNFNGPELAEPTKAFTPVEISALTESVSVMKK